MKEKEKDTHIIAAYGTLMKGFGNNEILNNSELIGEGKTDKLMTMTHQGIPFVTDKKEVSKICVEVYKVNDKTLFRLDCLEGHPSFYERKLTDITLKNGTKIKAWMYYCERLKLPIIETGNYKDKYKFYAHY